MEKKFKELEDFLLEKQISNDELADWLSKRLENRTILIPTALPLVYRKGNEFSVEKGLNLNRKNELWGLELFSGIMLALECGSGKDLQSTNWKNVKEFAEKMRFNGKSGSLPSAEVLINSCGANEEKKFIKTLKVLSEYKINACDGYWGSIWCAASDNSPSSVFFHLEYGILDRSSKKTTSFNDRVAVAFD